jgi:hypothetical protein
MGVAGTKTAAVGAGVAAKVEGNAVCAEEAIAADVDAAAARTEIVETAEVGPELQNAGETKLGADGAAKTRGETKGFVGSDEEWARVTDS